MLKVKVEIEGRGFSDIQDALTEIARLISAGTLIGDDKNSTGKYSFEFSGEPIPAEVVCDSCGFFGRKKEFTKGLAGKLRNKLSCPNCHSKQTTTLVDA